MSWSVVRLHDARDSGYFSWIMEGPGLVDCFCSWCPFSIPDFGQPLVWCRVRTQRNANTHTLHKHTCTATTENTHTQRNRRQSGSRPGALFARALTCSPSLAPFLLRVRACVCVCVTGLCAVVSEFSLHGSLFPFFFCFTVTENTRTAAAAAALLQSSFLDCGITLFLSLRRRGDVFSFALALRGFPTSTRTHARTHLNLHSQYRQRMMLSWVPRIFLLASSFCTALRNFPLSRNLALALASSELCKCVKKIDVSAFSSYRGGRFKSLRLWMMHFLHLSPSTLLSH